MCQADGHKIHPLDVPVYVYKMNYTKPGELTLFAQVRPKQIMRFKYKNGQIFYVKSRNPYAKNGEK